MPEREYIAYEGPLFTIEWYFNENGNSQALDYFNDLSEKEQDRLLYLLKRMGDSGKISDTTKFNFEGDGIYAFKPKPDRFLAFFIKGRKIIITNAFRKKTDKLPQEEKEKALRGRKDYTGRTAKNSYY